MPDHLSQMLEIPGEKGRREFREYLNLTAGNTRESELYELMRKHRKWETAEFAKVMYGKEDQLANVRKVRKRLTDRFILWLITSGAEQGPAQLVRMTLSLTDVLIQHNKADLALHYLNETEAQVKGPDASALLESIYYYRLRNADALGLNGEEEYARWEQNNRRYTTYMHLLGAEAVLENVLMQLRRAGRVPDQQELMSQFYARFATVEEERRNPVFMHTLATIFRRVLLSTKDYWRIEPSVQSIYDELMEAKAFTPETAGEQMGFLLMLSQAAYRNRRFVVAEEHLDRLQRLLPSPAPRNFLPYVKMISLRAAIFSYTSRYREAIAMLERHLFGDNPVTHVEERCQMIFNLALSEYCNQDFAGALVHLQGIGRSDQWLFERFGLEWIYKKQMVHVIILWDAGHYEAATRALEGMLEKYAAFLKQDLYQRAEQFMRFVLRYFHEPDIIRDIAFHREVRDAHMGWGEREDIHAILFFSWFRAKMLGRPFYPVMQARLKEEGDDWDYPFSLKD